MSIIHFVQTSKENDRLECDSCEEHMTHLFDAAVNNGFMKHAKLKQLAL